MFLAPATTADQLKRAKSAAPTSLDQTMAEMKITVLQVWDDFVSHLPILLIGLLVLFLTWMAGRLVNKVGPRLLARSKIRRSLTELIVRLVFITVWVLGSMVSAMVVFPGLTPSNALAALGAGSVAIGFAFKDIFENFIAGMIILANEPFEIGDLVYCSDIEGRVEEVNVRNTSIRRLDGQLVVVPNAMLFKNPVTVRTDLDVRRVTVIGGVGYGEDVDKACAVAREAVKKLGSVHKEREVQVYAKEFGASSVDFEITWWTGSPQIDLRQSRHEVIDAVKKALEAAGMEIPFPYRTLTFAEPLEIKHSPL